MQFDGFGVENRIKAVYAEGVNGIPKTPGLDRSGMMVLSMGLFGIAMVAMLRQQADVSQALVENGRLVLVLKDGTSVAPLISLIVREGGEVLDAIELDRGCFACALGGTNGTTLFMLAQEWNGPENMFKGPRSGVVLMTQAPAAGAGWP